MTQRKRLNMVLRQFPFVMFEILLNKTFTVRSVTEYKCDRGKHNFGALYVVQFKNIASSLLSRLSALAVAYDWQI